MPITRRRRANPPEQPENNNNNNHAAEQAEQAEQAAEVTPAEQMVTDQVEGEPQDDQSISDHTPNSIPPLTSVVPPTPPVSNGADQQTYTPIIEGGRRTARGELFRRPPQPPPTVAVPPPAPTIQAPTHEISLPLGNLLHLAYNPGYTGSEEARSVLLNQLANESKAGGRARCWNCGSIAIAYDRWSTRSKTFGEVGIAYCEICGVWSVL